MKFPDIGLSRALLGVVFLLACSDVTSPEEARKKENPTPPPATEPPSAPSPPVPGGSNPIAGATFWVSPTSNARTQASEWRASRPADAEQMDKIANQPQASWFGDWNSNVESAVNSYVGTVVA